MTSSPVWGGRSIDLCNGGGPVCESGGNNVAVHSAYAGGGPRIKRPASSRACCNSVPAMVWDDGVDAFH